jgi:hypothetical protein
VSKEGYYKGASTFQVLMRILTQVGNNIYVVPNQNILCGPWVRHYLLSAVAPSRGDVIAFVNAAFYSQLIPAVIANVLVLRCIFCTYVAVTPSKNKRTKEKINQSI